MNKLTALFIMDGYGINSVTQGNAVYAAKTPNLDKYCKQQTMLGASGMDVGLPNGQMGNSEVGHTNIGAGRVVYQELTRISKSISDGDFFENQTLIDAMQMCAQKNTKLHLFGLVSDGGVHSHNTHIYGLLDMAKQFKLSKVYVHCFLDGRDVAPTSGVEFVNQLEQYMQQIGVGKVATVMGRYYAMDRDNRWERVKKAYDAMVYGIGEYSDNAVTCIRNSYNADVTDEFVIPTVIDKNGVIAENDCIISFNFRPDRAREIARCFVDPEFNGFERNYFNVHYVCMTQYDAKMQNVSVAFLPQSLENTLGELLSKNGKKQLRIAETEKYAHVTFFFNGGVESVYVGEDRALIPSPKVATYDLQPEMSAYLVADECVKRIKSGEYDFICLNFANCDMVGHTGVFECAVRAVEAVDQCIGKVVEAVLEQGGVACITADHGNADQMIDPTDGGVFTAHTTNPVPFMVVGKQVTLRPGRLADIAPTILDLMGLEKPTEMSGESLIEH